MFEYTLEASSRKYTCPQCGAEKKFKRYVNRMTGESIAYDVGRCDRESSCGYHRKPKDHFLDNPQLSNKNCYTSSSQSRGSSRSAYKNNLLSNYEDSTLPKTPDYIESETLLRTLGNYDENSFVQFLLNLFPDDTAIVWQSIKDYMIGTTKDSKTIFWQVDRDRKVRTGEIMLFGNDGHRNKNYKNWIHAELKKHKLVSENFNLKQCLFGEHLLINESTKTIAVVEAVKTAVIASICFSEFVWLASGAKTWLNVEKLNRLGNRRIILFPDAEKDAFDKWQRIAAEARSQGLLVKVNPFIENFATLEQKQKGYDLADYLIELQAEINQINSAIDSYNTKLEQVLNDKKLNQDFETILDEQKSVLVINGCMSDAATEELVTSEANIRQVVLSL